jgi:arginyl-tRNA synthetase
MEDGDKDALALWQRFRDLSIVKYKEIYSRLNVSFDIYSGESQYSLGQMKSVLDELDNLGLLVRDQGALMVDLKKFDLGAAIIGKTDGSMLYLSRDIAANIERKRVYDFDEMFYVVGSQQEHHFKQLFKILELMGKEWAGKCHHINFGMIKSKDGNMSTRKGTVVFLEDILNHVQEEMHGVMKKNETKYAQIPDPVSVSDTVGMSAIMIQDMTARRNKDYDFDWNRMLSFEGDTGP